MTLRLLSSDPITRLVQVCSLLLLSIVTVLLAFCLLCAEALRNQATGRRSGWVSMYATGQFFLAPLNTWLGKNTLNVLPGQAPPVFYSPAEQFASGYQLLSSNWQKIRDEALALYTNGHTTETRTITQGRHINLDGGWRKFVLRWYGEFTPDALRLCPFTVSLLRQCPDVPLGMFSIMDGKSELLPHTGPSRGAIRYHLGLQCPEEASIVVDGQEYSWKDGEHVMFDDTYLHEVHNRSERPRLILFLDVERKLSTPEAQRKLHWMLTHVAPHISMTRKNRRTMMRQSVGLT